MLKTSLMILILALLIPLSSHAQETFEGVVEVKITNSRGDENNLKLFSRGNALRLESEAGEEVKNGNMIIKNDSIYILMPTEEKYIRMPINANNKVQNFSNKADNLKKIGETKDILGYQAEKWLFVEDGSTVEIWSTTELGNIVNLTYFIPEAANEVWYKNVFEEGFFPLSITVTNQPRNTVNKMEVTNVEKKTLEDSDFDLPEGFTQMETSRKN